MLKSHTRVILFILLLITLSVTPAAQGTPAPLSINVGMGSTDIILQNTGTADANVVVEYQDQSGNLRAYPAGIIKPKGAMELKASDIGDLGGSWIGSATASSDQQLAVVALTEWTGGGSKDGKVAGAYSGFPTGSQSTFIPYLLYKPSVTEPLITVQNTGTQEAVISMTYVCKNGVTEPFNLTNIHIPAGGQKTFDLSGPGEGVPNWNDSNFFKANGNWTGGVRIEALTGQSIAAVVTTHWRDWSAIDGTVSQGDTKLFAPNLARRIVKGKVLEIAYLSVQNMTNGDVSIKIELRDRTMPSVGKTIRRKLGPYGVAFFNTRWMTGLDRYPGDPDQDIWEGSATIEANGEVAGTVVMLRQEIKAASQYLAMGPSSGGTQVFFPLAYHIYSDSKPVQYSLLRLQNTTDTGATNVDIFFYDRTGKEIYKRLNRSIPARQSLGLNFKSLSALGSNFTGTVYVTSDQNLVGVMDILWSNLQLVSYNAISK